MFAALHELSGFSPVNLLSRQLFRDISKQQETALTPTSSAWLIGSLSLIATVASVYVTHRFSRRAILVPGYALLAFMLFLIGIADATHQNDMAYVIVLFYMIIYQLLNGSIVWLYLCETSAGDVQFGLTSFVMWMCLIIVTFISPPMIKGMHSGVFFIYSVMCVGGSVFCYFYIRETQGLTDIQKKQVLETGRVGGSNDREEDES